MCAGVLLPYMVMTVYISLQVVIVIEHLAGGDFCEITLFLVD